jgi:hypothetical protein
VADADRGQARTPHAVRPILQHALWLRDAHHAGTVDRVTLAAEADRLGAPVDKLVAGATRYPPNRRPPKLLERSVRRGELPTPRRPQTSKPFSSGRC